MEFSFFQKLGTWLRPKPKVETPAIPDNRVVAVGDLRDRWGSYPTSGLTPEKLSSIIRNSDVGYMTEVAEMYEEMEEKDPHLCSVLQTRKLAIRGLDMVIMPYNTDPNTPEGKESQKLADFVEHAIDRVNNFDQAVFNVLDAIGKGYSVSELNWIIEDGNVLVDSIDWIHPKKITFSDSFEPQLVTEKEQVKGEPFGPWKVIYFNYKARSGWDTRAGLIRVVALIFLLKNYCLKDWAVFNEVFGMPLRVGKYDPSASQSDKDALYAAIKAIGSDAAGIISKNTEIEFVSVVRNSGENPFLALQQYCNNEMSKAILGQTLTTDTAGATGTYSAGKIHGEVRQDILEADGMAIGEVLTKQLIYPLIGFNFGWDKAKAICPYIRFVSRKPVELLNLSMVYKNLLDAGVPISLNHINERFDLPELEEKEKYVGGDRLHDPTMPEPTEVVVTPAAKSEEEPEEEKAKIEAYFSKFPASWEKPIIMDQAKLDKIASDAVSMTAGMGKMILKPVEELIRNGGSLEEIKKGLTKVYGEIDPRQLADLLYMSMMLAYFQGYE